MAYNDRDFDFLSDAREDTLQDRWAEEQETYRAVCAMNNWSEDDYTFEDYCKDNF